MVTYSIRDEVWGGSVYVYMLCPKISGTPVSNTPNSVCS